LRLPTPSEFSKCSSRRYPYSPHGRVWNFLEGAGGDGFARPKKFEELYDA